MAVTGESAPKGKLSPRQRVLAVFEGRRPYQLPPDGLMERVRKVREIVSEIGNYE